MWYAAQCMLECLHQHAVFVSCYQNYSTKGMYRFIWRIVAESLHSSEVFDPIFVRLLIFGAGDAVRPDRCICFCTRVSEHTRTRRRSVSATGASAAAVSIRMQPTSYTETVCRSILRASRIASSSGFSLTSQTQKNAGLMEGIPRSTEHMSVQMARVDDHWRAYMRQCWGRDRLQWSGGKMRAFFNWFNELDEETT